MLCHGLKTLSRSREGAWIEIAWAATAWRKPFVAPARERGLKSRRSLDSINSLAVAPARERGLK